MWVLFILSTLHYSVVNSWKDNETIWKYLKIHKNAWLTLTQARSHYTTGHPQIRGVRRQDPGFKPRVYMCTPYRKILEPQKWGLAENHDFQIHLKADRIESRDLPQTIRDPAYASSPVSSLHWRNPGENLSDFEIFPAETWFLPDFSLRGYEIFCRACLPRNFRRASPPPSSPDFFQIFEFFLKKFKNEKNLKIFEKNFFFKKSWNIEKNTPLQDFSIFSPISTIFSTFSIFPIFSLLPTVWAVPL